MPITKNKPTGTLILLLLLLVSQFYCSQNEPQVFSTPDDAVVAMVDALRTGDADQLLTIFGPEAQAIVSSEDPVADRVARELFMAAYFEYSALDGGVDSKTLIVGGEHWPFPIPIVKVSSGWIFDTASGVDEILYRRIGRNELATIEVCQTYVAAQQEYAASDHEGKPAGAYAQKFVSTAGRKDGLYWEAGEGEDQSPLGPLAAEAAAEGQTRNAGERTPFRGYYFRILAAQGESAKSGATSYIEDGEMRDGFALVAYPAVYGDTGVMTFIVNQEGVVYEKDLGADTPEIADTMNEFNPDSTWAEAN